MAAGIFAKSGSLAALAAALAFVAVPVSAQEQGRWRGGGESGAQRGNDGGGRGNEPGYRGLRSESARQQPRQAAPAQVQPQVQAQAQPQARSYGEARRNGAPAQRWNGQRGNGAQTTGQVQAQAQQRDWSRGENRGDRGDASRAPWRANDGDRQRTENRRGDDNRWRGNDDRRDNDRWRGNDNRGRDNDGRWSNRGDNRGNYGNNARRWDNNWRSNTRYNWYGYRNANRNAYRLGSYYAPYRGYSYRRLGAGFFLDSLFFSNRYWINDPWSYRLPSADGSYRWVRYYDDVLLVDIYSGEVVDVIHDFFW
jgi:hypothetical protein